jgi:putative cell wall-binding protein
MKKAGYRAASIAGVVSLVALATGSTAAHAGNRTSVYARAARYGHVSYAAFTGDTISDTDDITGPLDIASVTRSGDASNVVITFTTYDTFTDQDGLFVVGIDADGDDIVEHEVVAGYDGIGLSAEISHGTPHTALATSVTRPDQKSLQITFARSLIGGATSFGWATIALSISGTTLSFDLAPEDDGFVPGYPAVRVAGGDRIETGIESSFYSPTLAKAVVIARSDGYADALAGAPLAVARNAPLLLNPTAELDSRVKTEIERALPTGGTVFLLGGVAALSQAVEDAITGDGYHVIRYQGDDRYLTALKIASDGLGNPSTLFLTSGTNFADALPAGPAAAVKSAAILLTDGTTVPQSVKDYLAAHPSATRFAVGGPAAAADPSATPVVGTDRYDTSRKVAATFFTNPSEVGVANGLGFADALGGGAAVGGLDPAGPLLLTDPTTLSTPTKDYLVANSGDIFTVYIFGGLVAVSQPVEDAINDALA